MNKTYDEKGALGKKAQNHCSLNLLQAYMRWVEEHGEEELLPGVNYTQTQLFFLNFAQVGRLLYFFPSTVLHIMSKMSFALSYIADSS